MPYSTPAMVRKALVATSDGSQPSEPTNTAADFTDEQLADEIAGADSVINGYIGGRYIVPVALIEGAVPHPLDYLSRDIAAYTATLTKKGSLEFTDNNPIYRRYSQALAFLIAVGATKATLQIPRNDTGTATLGAGAPINPNGQASLFGLRDFSLREEFGGFPDGFWRP